LYARNTPATGDNNIGIGAYALQSTGSSNVAVGDIAMATSGSGSFNTALGAQSLYSNTTASGNTAVGYQAGYSNTTGGLTAFGYQALYSHTSTGSTNTAVGYQAGYATTTGSIDAFGTIALRLNTTGTNNAAFGNSALQSNTTGNYNTAFGGFRVLGANTTGSNNVAVGAGALDSNTTASNNTAVGYQAGYSNQTGFGNTYIGQLSGVAALSSVNTFLGASSGSSVTTGERNTLIGHSAGFGLSTGSNNTFIGVSATSASGALVTTGSKNTILGGYNGNQNSLDIRTANNYIVLSDGDGNPRATWFPNGWVFGYPTYAPLTDEQVVAADNADGSMSAFLVAAAPNGGQSGFRLRAGVGTTYRATRIDFFQTPVSTTAPRWTLINDFNQNNTNDFRLYSGAYGNPVQTWNGDGTTSVYNTLGVGNTAGSTSGAGITFPATQSASSNANTLDDYEEGTWTATLTDGTNTTTSTGANYRKIGSLVFLSFQFYDKDISAWNAANLSVTGLPFTVATNHDSFVTVGTPNGFTVSGPLAMLFSNGSTSSGLYYRGGSSNYVGVQKGDITNNSDFSLYLSACYTAS
jgi:hypothetical protein